MKILHCLALLALIAPLSAHAEAPLNEGGVINWRYQDKTSADKPQAKVAGVRSNTGEKNQGFTYLNSLRTSADLIPFSWDNALETAAQNHAQYLILNNTFGHSETEGNAGFTGVNPWNRGDAAGYSPWYSYGENLSGGDDTIYESIDGLFTGIYHRFGFLTLTQDDIGIGIKTDAGYAYHSVYNYDMGNLGSTAVTQGQNGQTILWPPAGFSNAQTSFNNSEAPDPLPECPTYGIAGNPISIEFNPTYHGTATMNSFKLFGPDGSEITNTKTLTQATDPANHLNNNQFVLFPLTSLSVDSRYRVEFNYTEANNVKNLTWHFNTRRYDVKRYEVTDGNTYDVISGQTYLIHVKPANCTTILNAYSWSGNAVIERLNLDLFRISVTADTTFTFGSPAQFTFTLHPAASDNAIAPSVIQQPTVLPPILHLLLGQ